MRRMFNEDAPMLDEQSHHGFDMHDIAWHRRWRQGSSLTNNI